MQDMCIVGLKILAVVEILLVMILMINTKRRLQDLQETFLTVAPSKMKEKIMIIVLLWKITTNIGDDFFMKTILSL